MQLSTTINVSWNYFFSFRYLELYKAVYSVFVIVIKCSEPLLTANAVFARSNCKISQTL